MSAAETGDPGVGRIREGRRSVAESRAWKRRGLALGWALALALALPAFYRDACRRLEGER